MVLAVLVGPVHTNSMVPMVPRRAYHWYSMVIPVWGIARVQVLYTTSMGPWGTTTYITSMHCPYGGYGYGQDVYVAAPRENYSHRENPVYPENFSGNISTILGKVQWRHAHVPVWH